MPIKLMTTSEFLIDSFNSSNVIFRNAGFSTSGEIDDVLLVGPIAPATNLGFKFVENSFAASLAILADSKLIS